MQFFLNSIAIGFLALPTVFAQLTKPVLAPPFPSLDIALYNALPSATVRSIKRWTNGDMPEKCKVILEREKTDPKDATVFEVTYSDCDQSWIFCRHNAATTTEAQIIDVFGRLPIGSRSVIRHFVAVPGAISAYNWDDDILLSGTGPNLMTLLTHETAHSLDSHVPNTRDPRFSTGPTWEAAYNLDSAVSDDYARTNQIENFAQMTVLALYDNFLPGKLQTIQPNLSKIKHQLAAVKTALGGKIAPGGGRCQSRLANSPIINVKKGATPTAAVREWKRSRKQHDVSLRAGITELQPATQHKHSPHHEAW